MATTKPDYTYKWASDGDKIAPSDAKIQTGWSPEIPPYQWENFIQNRQDEMLAYLNERGIPEWDNRTDYIAGKSYVQGSDGRVYKSVSASGPTTTVQDPVTDSTDTYWTIAFADVGAFLDQTAGDARYTQRSNNLSDLTNVATARTNLSVYSQAETYTKAEVDSKTTVASTAQAQELASNTTLITPLRLAEAFRAGNQLIGSNGFQKIPGGLIVQWGVVAEVTTEGQRFVVYPVTFPTGTLQIVIGGSSAVVSNTADMWPQVVSFTASGFYWHAQSINNSFASSGARWIAIGH